MIAACPRTPIDPEGPYVPCHGDVGTAAIGRPVMLPARRGSRGDRVIWVWDKTDAGKPGLSGDIAKMFRHEEPKAPGAFAVDDPPAPATLLAREVIQNSWDAARELAEELGPRAPQFEIEFRFKAVTGAKKRDLSNALDLRELAERLSAIDRHDIGLGKTDCLDALDDDSIPLRFLEIAERGSTGMYGPWDQKKSHMYLALVSLGFTEKMTGAGGSYGYGKAGLITGSRIRTVVAYTCFRERDEDPGITRRLLGMAYWGSHELEGHDFTGFGSFSADPAERIDPFTNEQADRVAESLGIERRDPATVEQLGTTFLLVDPTVDAGDLVRAIERSWWPALHENEFVVSVVDYDGVVSYPRPKRDELLRSFIDAWELATGAREPGSDEYSSEVTGFGRYPIVGRIGLVTDLKGWSFADQKVGPDDGGVDHRSLVALTRGPRMVVEYFVAGRSEPYIRGVFIADESVDDVLRRTEPKAHDAWQRRGREGEVDFEAAKVADHVLRRIGQAVNNLRQRVKPPTPPPEQMNLPLFNDIMRRVMSGMGGGVRQPVPDTRPISIHLEYAPSSAGDQVKMSGRATFSLSDNFKGDEAEVELSIMYRFVEDERVGEEASLDIRGPEDMEKVREGVFRGRLIRGQQARFRFESEAYDPNWTGRLLVNGEVLSAQEMEGPPSE